MWRGERSSWRCTNNGGCRGITRIHRGITKVHSGAARCRRRGIVNPIHAAFIKGLGDNDDNSNNDNVDNNSNADND